MFVYIFLSLFLFQICLFHTWWNTNNDIDIILYLSNSAACYNNNYTTTPYDTTTKYKLYLKYQPLQYEEAWSRWKKWQKDRIKKPATLKRKIVSTNQFNTSSSLSNFLSEKEKEKDKKSSRLRSFCKKNGAATASAAATSTYSKDRESYSSRELFKL